MTTLPTKYPLARAFYERDTVVVARALLGQRLVRVLNGQRLSGLICETEAYGGADDPASHAYRRTPRSAIMSGPPGIAYIYGSPAFSGKLVQRPPKCASESAQSCDNQSHGD